MASLRRVLLVLILLYLLLWLGVLFALNVLFSDKQKISSLLEEVFQQSVTVVDSRYDWKGLSPRFYLRDVVVAPKKDKAASFSFETFAVELNPFSLLLLSPKFNQAVLFKPQLEIETRADGKTSVAGIVAAQGGGLESYKSLAQWLLSHSNLNLHDGQISWRKPDGRVQEFSSLTAVYKRDKRKRVLTAHMDIAKQFFAYQLEVNGDMFKGKDWDAMVTILGGGENMFISPDDLSFNVVKGRGEIQLTELNISRLREYCQLIGVKGGFFNWLIDSQLSGRLHDVMFEFSGAMLDFEEWDLQAQASDVAFKAVDSIPAMSNLAGELQASNAGGKFSFAMHDSQFKWPKWLHQTISVKESKGDMKWLRTAEDRYQIELNDGLFSDEEINLSDVNITLGVQLDSKQANAVADFFKIKPVEYIVDQAVKVFDFLDDKNTSVSVLADGRFSVNDIRKIQQYVPNKVEFKQFYDWWGKAFLSGQASDGQFSYRGKLDKQAIYNGQADLQASAKATNVELDYGYANDWPVVKAPVVELELQNDKLSILPQQAVYGKDKVKQGRLKIDYLFDKNINLTIDAELDTKLSTVMEFLFDGPLIPKKTAKTNKQDKFPVTASAGEVSSKMQIKIPLTNIVKAKVTGRASVSKGALLLPGKVPVSNISGDIEFSEESVLSNNLKGRFLSGGVSGKLITTKKASPPDLRLIANGTAKLKELKPWLGTHLLSWLDGQTKWHGQIDFVGAKTTIITNSDLIGANISAPPPLAKDINRPSSLELMMQFGSNVHQRLSLNYDKQLTAEFRGDLQAGNSFLDQSMISLGGETRPKPGVNFDIRMGRLDVDAWIDAIDQLTQIKTDATNSEFLDAMRSIKIQSSDPLLFGRNFAALDFSSVSVDGRLWIGRIEGDNIKGTFRTEPREDLKKVSLDISRLNVVDPANPNLPLSDINQSLLPSQYPDIDVKIDSFSVDNRNLGQLTLRGKPIDGVWKLSDFNLQHNGIKTKAEGQWANPDSDNNRSQFYVETVIDEAGNALDNMKFDGIIKKGKGYLKLNLNWAGAPHKFEYARLNGDFNFSIRDGELVKIEPGTGKLLGLLNFNAILRRMTLDFSDVFASGLQFDHMKYEGLVANGEAILRNAFILTPAVFLRMQGKAGLVDKSLDLEVKVSPELGGNIALLSALANPAAGAVVFLTQKLFEDELREATFKSYKVIGSWKDFEVKEMDLKELDKNNSPKVAEAQ